MRRTSTLICGILISVIIWSCRDNKTSDQYLSTVLANLEKIESATYYEEIESWYPGDTAERTPRYEFVNEYNNPSDTTIGASIVSFEVSDTTQLAWGYDGDVKAIAFHEHNGILLDDFSTRKLPFRPMSVPFFNYTRNMIHYVLTTSDSIEVTLDDLGEEYHFKMVIYEDKQVEFFGKAHYIPEGPFYVEPTSRYEIWIKKSDNLPYKVLRDMSHNVSLRTCTDAKLNVLSIEDFNLYSYFPEHYEVKKYDPGKSKKTTSELISKKAPDWILNNMYGQPVSLDDFKSKVLLVNLTGIGCGPCHASIPYLRELSNLFTKEQLQLVAIETWARKPHSLQHYADKNNINYPFLSATDEVIEAYQTGGAVPAFFILDEHRIVRKTFEGYSVERTGDEITKAIKELL